ncbi:MAG: DegQ family serine endoprotease [Burkholderiaceae bacterium]
MNTRNFTASRLLLALVAAGVIGGAGATYVAGRHAHATTLVATPAAAVVATPSAALPVGQSGTPDFSQITERYGPAVVNISVSGIRQVSDDGPAVNGMPPGVDPDDPFFEFFRRFQGGVPQPHDTPVRGEGSGFVVSPDGLILTNAHVVRNATEVIVKLTDRREFKARVLGADPKTDVAVLKIDAEHLPVVPLGSSRDLKVGEWVLAIGSPFGFENSVTAGVVSAKGRSLPDDSFVPFIQTDVAINPGNSGGPLFNARGEVVGINSQIYSRSGGYQGLSFAIPIEVVTQVRDQIVATGQASHARLGVTVQEVNQALAESFGLAKPEGALVSGVEPGGPAETAGLKAGDVIIQVNGQAIIGSGDLPALIGQSAPGTEVTLNIWRQGRQEAVQARLGDAGEKPVQVAQAIKDRLDKARLGLALRPLQPQELRSAGVDGGLVIEDVAGPAETAGVQQGDVLMAVNGTPVRNIEQVRAAVAKSSRSVALLIQRDGNTIFVPVRLG